TASFCTDTLSLGKKRSGHIKCGNSSFKPVYKKRIFHYNKTRETRIKALPEGIYPKGKRIFCLIGAMKFTTQKE
ncbi:MAG: hypothetical protein K2N94_00400, partial [Lachnospiraceae bacterium]|nr:hypothetical protein [Lachnospiraceae bacterium]